MFTMKSSAIKTTAPKKKPRMRRRLADEFMEILMLVQTGKMQKTPVILMGKEFWQPLLDWFKKTMLEKYHTINPQDIKLFTLVDKAEDAFKIIKKSRERTIF